MQLPEDLLASNALPINTLTLDTGTLAILRRALKHSGKTGNDLLKLLRQLLVSLHFKVCARTFSLGTGIARSCPCTCFQFYFTLFVPHFDVILIVFLSCSHNYSRFTATHSND